MLLLRSGPLSYLVGSPWGVKEGIEGVKEAMGGSGEQEEVWVGREMKVS